MSPEVAVVLHWNFLCENGTWMLAELQYYFNPTIKCAVRLILRKTGFQVVQHREIADIHRFTIFRFEFHFHLRIHPDARIVFGEGIQLRFICGSNDKR